MRRLRAHTVINVASSRLLSTLLFDFSLFNTLSFPLPASQFDLKLQSLSPWTYQPPCHNKIIMAKSSTNRMIFLVGQKINFNYLPQRQIQLNAAIQ